MIQVCDPPRQRQVRRLSAEEFFTLVRCGGAGFYRPCSEVLRMLTAGEAWGTAGAALLVLPMAVSLLYGEKCALSFALTILVALAVGFLLTKLCRGEHGSSSIKDGFMIVALTWIMLSAIGALPFVFSREIPLYVDAFFETVSGFTTTGATVLPLSLIHISEPTRP